MPCLASFLVQRRVATGFGESRSGHAGIVNITVHPVAVSYDGRQAGALSEKRRQPCDSMHVSVYVSVTHANRDSCTAA